MAADLQQKQSIEEEEEEEEEEEHQEDEYEKEMEEMVGEETEICETKKRKKEKTKTGGVAYLGHVPPALRPNKLRTLLSEFGEIGRIYLAPREPSSSGGGGVSAARDARGRQSRHYHEGWVEFRSKSACRRACSLLNGTSIGGRRKSKHYHDLWCIRYVRGLKWDMINEERTEKRVQREHRIREELATARRDRDFYLSRVDQAKAIAAMEERKGAAAAGGAARRDDDVVDDGAGHQSREQGRESGGDRNTSTTEPNRDGNGDAGDTRRAKSFKKRDFKQRRAGTGTSKKLSGGLLSALFGGAAE